MPIELTNPLEVQPSRPSDIRQANRRILLRLLKRLGSCSKADLVRLSGLSAPTVTAAVQGLEQSGLVETLGEGPSSGGRPPEMLRFNAEHGYVAGADIGGTRLRMMLSDLNGKTVAHWKGKLAASEKDPDSITRLVHRGLLEMCAEIGITKDRVQHITVGAPGITDVERGVVLSAPNLTDWIKVPLRELIEAETGISALAENDTNLAAVGEHWMGAAKGVDDFVFIAMGTGVGSGIFLRGQLHHGAAWSAGEIGYLGVPGMQREIPQIEKTGQLERTIGGAGIEELWHSHLQRSNRASDPVLSGLRGAEIFDLAAEGDADASAVLDYTAGVLADAIATITLLFNPSLVILGGGVGSHELLRRETERHLADSDFPHPAIRTSLLGTQAQLYGTIALSLTGIEGKLLC